MGARGRVHHTPGTSWIGAHSSPDIAPDLTSYLDTSLKPGTARHYRTRSRAGNIVTEWTDASPPVETQDDAAPQLEAITVPVTGDYVHIRFDEELGEDVPGPEAFTVKVRSITRPVRNVEHSLVHHDIKAIDEDKHIVLALERLPDTPGRDRHGLLHRPHRRRRRRRRPGRPRQRRTLVHRRIRHQPFGSRSDAAQSAHRSTPP